MAHKKKSGRVYFCSFPNCKQTKYRDVCKVSWKFEAHHILCVAELNGVIGKKEMAQEAIKRSKWCINSKINMVALPLWGTTVMYYCKGASSVDKAALAALRKGLSGSLLVNQKKEPAFVNLPQHNYGHSGEDNDSSYSEEVRLMLADWMTTVQLNIKRHAITAKDVTEDLNDMAKTMRRKLQNRGKRRGSTEGIGTHHAWRKPAKNWYRPFSMANKPTEMPLPAKTDKIVELAEKFWRA